MAFANNPSAFAIKPTGQPGTSAFGPINTSNPLFGGASSQGTSSFAPLGSQPQAQNQAPAQGSSLFGAPLGQNPNQQQQQAGAQPGQGSSFFGGGFGQNANQQQQAQPTQGPSLFSGYGQNQHQQQNQQQQQQQQQQPGQGTSLFGSTNVGAQQPALPPSLFGQPAANNQQKSSFFATPPSNNATQQQGGLGIFGTNTNNVPTLGNWGSTSTNPLLPQSAQSAGAFGQSTLGTTNTNTGSLFGRPAQSSFSTNAPSSAPAFMRSTKFNDLPDEVKKLFENIDAHIQGRVQISNNLKQRKLGDEAVKGQEGVRGVHKDLVNGIATLHSDVLHTRDLKAKVDQTVQDTIIAMRIVDGFRNPQQHGAHLKNHANFPLEFFQRVTEEMRERLRWYKTTIEQIERKLSSAAAQSQYTPQTISSTLEAQHATFIALASKTASLDNELQKLKTLYTQLWRARTGSMRDPFNDLDRGPAGDFGLESLHGK